MDVDEPNSSSDSASLYVDYDNDLIACLITNSTKSSILLKNYKFNDTTKNKEFTISNKSYWFPFKYSNNKETFQEIVDDFIQEIEVEYLKIIQKPEKNGTAIKKDNKLDSFSLVRIYSMELLPVEKKSKVIYLLCVLNESSELLNLSKTTVLDINEFEYRWMDYNQIKISQKNYQLMGLEPVTLFKLISESNFVNIYFLRYIHFIQNFI